MDLASRRSDLEATLATARARRAQIAYAVEFEGADKALLNDAITDERAAEARLESYGHAVAVAAERAQAEADAAARERRKSLRTKLKRVSADSEPPAKRIDAALGEILGAWKELDAILGEHSAIVAGLFNLDGGNSRDAQARLEAEGHFRELFAIRITSILARGGLILPAGEDYIREADIVEGRPSGGQRTFAELVANRLHKARAHAKQILP